MMLIFGTDHGGWEMKNQLITWLQAESPFTCEIIDKGAFQLDPQDNYPDFGLPVARLVSAAAAETEVATNPDVMGVLLCRSGAGMMMLANRFQGVRATTCNTPEAAHHARAKNNANILVLEGDYITVDQAKIILTEFATTTFDGGRHIARLQAFARLGSAPDAL
jgi:RpiB/LacA/LacB family sugar-phosphate isomerase